MSGSAQSPPEFLSGQVPLYYQLGTVLREKILSGQFSPGEQMPTENDLVTTYGVSRITVRQALKILEEEDLIRREAGRGTFVTGSLPQRTTLEMDGSLDDLMSMGLATSVRLLDLRPVSATRDDAADFEIAEGAPLVQCTRLRLYHDEPYSYIVNRLPQSIADRFEEHDWETGSILKSLEKRLGLRVRVADQVVRASLADSFLAGILETRIGAPLLAVDRVVRDQDGRALERVHTYYRGDIYSLTVHLTRTGAEAREDEDWALRDNGGSS
jgi:GntR family transcriptional regulator